MIDAPITRAEREDLQRLIRQRTKWRKRTRLSFDAIANADPPVAEQLISPGTLRQRRYGERHRNAQVTSRDGGGE